MGTNIRDALVDARAHLGAAQAQRAPTDDRIIAGHIDAAERILRLAISEMRHQRSRVLPLARLDALQGNDTPDEAA